jgi:hypothetical protein
VPTLDVYDMISRPVESREIVVCSDNWCLLRGLSFRKEMPRVASTLRRGNGYAN